MAWDLAFPEVFWPDGAGGGQGGFDAVLSNPPWDIMQPNTAEFLAGFDLSILDAPSSARRMRSGSAAGRSWGGDCLPAAIRSDSRAASGGGQALSASEAGCAWRRHGREAGPFPRVCGANDATGGRQGAIGMVVPSAFHANEGATGIRQLYLRQTRIEQCLSFENRHKLFDIDSRFKFALVVARRPGPTQTVRCSFYLTEFAQIDEPGGRWTTIWHSLRHQAARIRRCWSCEAARCCAGTTNVLGCATV